MQNNFSKQRKKNILSLHYSWGHSYLLLDVVRIYQFKAKDSEITAYALSLENISKDFSVNDVKETGINGYVYESSVI